MEQREIPPEWGSAQTARRFLHRQERGVRGSEPTGLSAHSRNWLHLECASLGSGLTMSAQTIPSACTRGSEGSPEG